MQIQKILKNRNLIAFLIAAVFALFMSSASEAQILLDFGTIGGQISSNGTSADNPAIFNYPTFPSGGAFFYGQSAAANAILKGSNPGLLRLGSFTEAQASAGNGVSEFNKFGLYRFSTNNRTHAYAKFNVVFAGDSLAKTSSSSGVWYYVLGDGAANGYFMYNNILPINLAEAGAAFRWTYTTNGGLTFARYDYATTSWIDVTTFAWQQGKPYTFEVYLNINKSTGKTYKKRGRVRTLLPSSMDVYVNSQPILSGVNSSGRDNVGPLKKLDSYSWYGTTSNNAWIFVDDSYATDALDDSFGYYTIKPANGTALNLSSLSSWTINDDGSAGTQPTSFSDPNATWIIRNYAGTTDVTYTLSSNININGVNSEIILGDSGQTATLTIPSGLSLLGPLDVNSLGYLKILSGTNPLIRSTDTLSTVEYGASGDQTIVYPLYYNLKTSGTGIKTISANVFASGLITAGDGTNSGTLTSSTFGLNGNISVGANYTLKLLSSSANASNLVFGTLGTGSTVEYGSADVSQSVFPGGYYDLIFSGNTKTFSPTGTIGIKNTLTPGTTSGHTVTGSSVDFNGTSAQTFTSSSYNFVFNNLKVSNTAGLTVGSDITVNGDLNLPNSNPSALKGSLDMSSTKILLMGPSAANTGTGDVTGIVKRTSISLNTPYTFGSPYTTLDFSGGTPPTDVSVKTVFVTPFPYSKPGINRYYDIIKTGAATGNNVIVKLRYLTSELNGNTAANLDVFDYHISGSSWHDHGKANSNLTEGWVSTSSTTDYVAAGSFDQKYWTLSNSTEPIFLWTGTVSSDWNDPANWAGGRIPLTTDYVVIPGGTPNDPTLPSSPAAVAKKIHILSGATLNGGSGTITLSGSSGAWQNEGTFVPGSSTVKFTGANATISGTTDFCGIVIEDGASLTPLTNSYIGVNCSLTRGGTGTGTFYASANENTIEYKGSGAQTVLEPNDGYHTLKFSGAGTKDIPFTSLLIDGDFINNGTYTYNPSLTVEMAGPSAQTIGGTGTIAFNNLTLNNPNGVSLSNDVTVNGTFTLADGSLDIGGNDLYLNGDVTPGTNLIIASNCGTVYYNKLSDGQNVLPGNYGAITFSNYQKVLPSTGTIKIACAFTPGTAPSHEISGSTIEFNGTGTQDQTIPAFKYFSLVISNEDTPNNIILPSGTIYVSGNFISNSATVKTLPADNVFEFNGAVQQAVSAFNFDDLTVNNPGGILLTGDITLKGTLTFTNGILDTYFSDVTFEPTANHTAEKNASYLLGTAIMQPRAVGTGALEFLYIKIAAGTGDLGNVSITRVTGPNGVVTVGSYSSIACKWDVTPSILPFTGTRNVTYYWPTALDNSLNFSPTLGQVYYLDPVSSGWLTEDAAKSVTTTDNLRNIQISATNISEFTISNVDNPLPVTLSSFTSNTTERNVKLFWTSSKEINNAGFEIERAAGRTEDLVYQKVGFIAGKGNSNSPVSYSFTDVKLESGKYKYRLKQIDYNGNFEYFELNNEVEVGIPGKFSLSQNYPNPFNPVTKIDFDLPLNSKINLVIYDVTGREVKTLLNEDMNAGYHTITFNAANTLASGVYFYRLIAKSSEKDFVSIKRMVLVK